MKIRPATEGDASAVGQLWLELVAYHRALDDNMPLPAEDGALRYAHRVRNSLHDSYVQIYVAEIDGVVVGYVLGTIVDLLPEMFVNERSGFIADIFVTERKRRQGIGKALMQAIRHWFKLRGVTHYEWYVASANQAAIAFWQQMMHGQIMMLRMRAAVDED